MGPAAGVLDFRKRQHALVGTMLAALLLCSLLGLAAFISAFRGDVPDPPLTLHDLPEGISADRIQGTGVYFKRSGDEVVGFLAASPHLGMPLRWCPGEQVFFGVGHGELFDAEGRAIDGPTPRGMDRFDVAVMRTLEIVLDPAKVEPGGPKVAYEDRTKYVSQETIAAVDTPNSGFCRAHVRPPT